MDEAYFTKPVVNFKDDNGKKVTIDIEGTTLQQIDNPSCRVVLKTEGKDGALHDFIKTPVLNLCKIGKTKTEGSPFVKMIIDDLMSHGNFSNGCPIPKGGYYVHDYQFSPEKIPAMAPVGKYRLDTEILVDDKVIWKSKWKAELTRA